MVKTKLQRIYFAISLIAVATGLLLSFFYRPYAYLNKLNDFGLADTIGSLVSVVGFCFLYWSLKTVTNKVKNIHILLAIFIYAVVWELFGILGLMGTFDWRDMVAALISGVITFILKEIVNWKFTTIHEKNE